MSSVDILRQHPEIRRCRIAIERLQHGQTVGNILQPDAEFVGYVVNCANPDCSWKRAGLGLNAADEIGLLISKLVRRNEESGYETKECGGVVVSDDGIKTTCPRSWKYSVEITYREDQPEKTST